MNPVFATVRVAALTAVLAVASIAAERPAKPAAPSKPTAPSNPAPAKPAAPVKPKVVPAKRDPWPVTVQPLPRTWAKRLVAEQKRERERVDELLDFVRENQDENLDQSDLDFLRRHRDEAIPVLRKAIEDGWSGKGTAFTVLLELGDPGARERWFAEFRKGDPKTRAELLRINATTESWSKITTPRNDEETAFFLEALKKGPGFTPEVAFHLADPSPAASAIIDEMPGMPASRQWAVAVTLAGCKLPAAEVRRILEWVRNHPRKEEDELVRSLEVTSRLLKLGGDTAADTEKLFLELDSKKPGDLQMEWASHILKEFCDVASEASRPLIERLFKELKNPADRAVAFGALARMRGTAVLPELEPLIGPGENEGLKLWSALRALALSGAREQADAWIIARFPMLDRGGVDYAIRFAGPEVIKRALSQKTNVSPAERFALRWRLDGTTYAKFFGRLVELGLATRVPTKAEIDAWKNLRTEDVTDAHEAIPLIADVGAMRCFAPQAEVQPPPYNDLLHDFASLTGGVFKPAGISYKQAGDDPVESPVAVEFGAAGKLLKFNARGILGKVYDLDATHAAVNRALELAGRKERVMAIESDTSMRNQFVFGLPEKWQQFASEFALPLVVTPPPAGEDLRP